MRRYWAWLALLVTIGAMAAASRLTAAESGDWPQFRGPNRDGICSETGLLQQWPEGGPKLLWRIDGLGEGFSSVSIVGDVIYTLGDREGGGQEAGQYVIALAREGGKELWATRIGPMNTGSPGGSRSTPTVDGDRLYVIGSEGDLACLSDKDGQIVWRKHLVNDFGGQMMSVWKFSESPLVDGQKVVCTPGVKQAGLVALDKATGETIWKCALPDLGENGKEGAGYSSMVVAEIDGVRQYVQLLGQGLVGVEAETGKFLWGYNRVANDVANISSPVVHGNHVFASTAYRAGAGLVKVTRQGAKFQAEEVYFVSARDFQNHHGGVVLVGDHIYGGHGQNKGDPTCLALASGEILWKERQPAPGSAAVLYADGNIIFRFDRGAVALVEATPEAFRLKGMFEPPTGEGPAWAHPVIHQGRLYLRHGDLLLCYDVRR